MPGKVCRSNYPRVLLYSLFQSISDLCSVLRPKSFAELRQRNLAIEVRVRSKLCKLKSKRAKVSLLSFSLCTHSIELSTELDFELNSPSCNFRILAPKFRLSLSKYQRWFAWEARNSQQFGEADQWRRYSATHWFGSPKFVLCLDLLSAQCWFHCFHL